MNPETNELRYFEDGETIPKGFIPIPKTLRRAADLKLNKKKSVMVSKTSGGKLSKWAAKKRREHKKQKMMVDNCNKYYAGI